MVNKSNTSRIIIGVVCAAIFFFPVYAVAIGGFKTNGQLLNDPFGLPNPATFEAYKMILLKSADFWVFLGNSVVVSGLVILLTLVTAIPAALAISRIEFRGNKFFYNFFIMGMLFPITVAILPLYLQLRNFGLLGTRLGLILSQAAFSLPMSIFIMTGFFKDIPKDLQEAVYIDGGTFFTFGFKIILPLSSPVISTVTIITLIQSWNQFLMPLLVLNDTNKFTIPLGIMQFQGQFTTNWNQIMAFITIALLPMVLLYIFLQKYIISGLTAGAVKG
ncbi:MAG: carbohydrate ABC transporter permease [Spirochaetales bacterium]|nr:carbohydrate ABC transporter permease [Spirochaetales bacterium]